MHGSVSTASSPDRGLPAGSGERAVSPPAGRISVVHVAVPAPVGGMESVLRSLAASQARHGLAVGVALVELPGVDTTEMREYMAEAGVDIEHIRIPARAYLRERRGVRDYLRRRRPTVVHTHSYRPDVIDAPIARRLGIPTVTTLHGSSFMAGSLTGEFLQRRAIRQFDGIVAVSTPLVGWATGLGVRPERVHLVPNAVVNEGALSREAAREHLDLPQDEKVIGWVARMIPIKAADVFVRALGEVGDVGPWRAVIIGDGPERERCEAIAREVGVEGKLEFKGLVPSARKYLRAFDVLALTSHSEGTPMTLLEAMVAGVPIVATRVGGVPELLGDGGGRLAEPDDPTSVAAALTEWLTDRDAALAGAGLAEKRAAAEYSGEAWAEAHERVYEAAAGL